MIVVSLLALQLLSTQNSPLTPEQQAQIESVRKLSGTGKGPDTSKARNEMMVNGHEPHTCLEKCQSLKQMMSANMENATKKQHKSAAAGKQAQKIVEDMADQCSNSCKAKGDIDMEYIKEHMKKPQAPPGRSGPRPSGVGGGSSDDSGGSGE